MSRNGDDMSVTKVFTGIAVMLGAVRVWKPLIVGVIRMGMMGLVKTRVIYGFGYPFHAHEEHRDNK